MPRPLVVGFALAAALLWSAAQASEVPVAWQLVDEGWPNERSLLYYDDSVGRVRALELTSSGNPPRMWELGGDDHWHRFFPGGDAPLEETGCTGYDSVRNVLVHVDQTGATHELGAAGWTAIAVSTGPRPPKRCDMVFDSSRGVMVYIGVDEFGSDAPNATWEYDALGWAEIDPLVDPPLGQNPELAYDSTRGLVLLYGEPFDETLPVQRAFVWEYSGTAWTPITPLGVLSPGRRSGHAWVYDSIRGRALLYSGVQDLLGSSADLWEWDGQSWALLEQEAAPGARRDFEVVHDADGARNVYYGGRGEPARELLTTWTLAGSAWSAVSTWQGPLGFAGYGMTILGTSGEILHVAGRDAHSHASDETWIWDDEGWRQDSLASPPTAWWSYDLAHDPQEDLVIGFGGTPYPNQVPVPDTHRYEGEGVGWVSSEIPGPRARRDAGIAYSRYHGRVFLFGGLIHDGLGVELDDSMWEYTSGGWSRLTVPEPRPSARENCWLAADSASGNIWMYGGADSWSNRADLWRFDGSSWTLLGDDSPPGERPGHGLAYDPTRDRLIVFGDGPTDEGVTWEWDGVSWQGRATENKPEPDRYGIRLVYDETRRAVFLFGGAFGTVHGGRYDLWAYGADPDGDGNVGKLDNCPETVNPGQANTDDDPLGDACDCALGDPGVWAAPPEISAVTFDDSGEVLSWSPLDESAGPNTVYDVIRGNVIDLPVDPSTPAACIGESLTTASLSDTESPPAGSAWWYLTRGRNTCGSSSYGWATGGAERESSACAP